MEIEETDSVLRVKFKKNDDIKAMLVTDFKSEVNPNVSMDLGITEDNKPEVVTLSYPKDKYSREYIENKISSLGKSDCSPCEIISVMIKGTVLNDKNISLVDKINAPKLLTLRDMMNNLFE